MYIKHYIGRKGSLAERREKEKNNVNGGHYALPATTKGSTQTLQ
jgi:hypothetical protein